jgi:hypothetical protein
MKILAAVAATVLFTGCSSGPQATLVRPEIELVQLSGPADQNYSPGRIEVQYGVRISNRSSEPITLRQIQIQSTGAGGPYRLERATYYFDRQVKPESYEDVTFWARAFASGDAFAIDAQAPVTIRAAAYFDAASGNFREVFTKMLNQTGRAPE